MPNRAGMAQVEANGASRGIYGVGDGLGVGGMVVGGALQLVCRPPAPKLLRMATAIPNWSSVMGPIDSAT